MDDVQDMFRLSCERPEADYRTSRAPGSELSRDRDKVNGLISGEEVSAVLHAQSVGGWCYSEGCFTCAAS